MSAWALVEASARGAGRSAESRKRTVRPTRAYLSTKDSIAATSDALAGRTAIVEAVMVLEDRRLASPTRGAPVSDARPFRKIDRDGTLRSHRTRFFRQTWLFFSRRQCRFRGEGFERARHIARAPGARGRAHRVARRRHGDSSDVSTRNQPFRVPPRAAGPTRATRLIFSHARASPLVSAPPTPGPRLRRRRRGRARRARRRRRRAQARWRRPGRRGQRRGAPGGGRHAPRHALAVAPGLLRRRRRGRRRARVRGRGGARSRRRARCVRDAARGALGVRPGAG